MMAADRAGAAGAMAVVVAIVLSAATASAQQMTAEVELETRAFPRAPLFESQARNHASLRFQPEMYLAWDRGRTTFTAEPFLRVDAADGRRSHVDLRELSFVRAWDAAELRIGVRTVFWGVTESQHLVDVINQTDLVENPDGEDKLGQPMVNLAIIQPWGTLSIYVLPWFRERTYPGTDGRLRFPLPVSDEAQYESGAGRHHLDWAVRWSQVFGNWDVGVSHFAGTNRQPRLETGIDSHGRPVLVPHYDLTNQTGVDVQHTRGSWLFKFEGITRTQPTERMYALTAGLEYTFYGVVGSDADVGVIGEYLWDSRDTGVTPFDDDVALGTRLAFNDAQSSQLLAVAVLDRRGGGGLVSVEGDRRFGASWRVGLEARGFLGMTADDPLYALRRDAYVGLTVTRFF